jgi:hypothetical protein
MLLLSIALAWLAVVIVIVAVCQAAGRSEHRRSAADESRPEVIREGLTAWDPVAARALRAQYAARRQRMRTRGRQASGPHARARRARAEDLGPTR